jgi:hypothetical protein
MTNNLHCGSVSTLTPILDDAIEPLFYKKQAQKSSKIASKREGFVGSFVQEIGACMA